MGCQFTAFLTQGPNILKLDNGEERGQLTPSPLSTGRGFLVTPSQELVEEEQVRSQS